MDELDKRIVDLLIKDPRTSNKTIAAETDITVATVASRLRRLFDGHVIKILPAFDWRTLGFNVEAYVYVEVAKLSPLAVARALSLYPGILTAAATLGGSDLLLLIADKDDAALHRLISRIADTDGVSSIHVDRINAIQKYRSLAVKLPMKPTNPSLLGGSGIALDPLDRQIIKMLQADGRLSSREIGRRLDAPGAKIRSRIRRIEDSGLMALRTVVNPSRSEMALQPAYVLSIVATEDPLAVAERLRALPAVVFVALTQGRFDVVAVTGHIGFPEVSAMINDLWSNSDIRAIKSLVVLDFLKTSPDLIRI